jgi:D-3-phosphoglycerate dehydrogenase
MAKVLIADKLSPEAAQIFKDNNVEVDVKVGMTPAELLACCGEYDGIAIRSATKITAEVIAAAKKLKVVGRAGIGVDNVDREAATAAGVIVMNTPFGNSVTTAEHAIAMMMSLARQIPAATNSTHAGKWEKSGFMGVEVMGKTLGLIGAGNIGSIVADRAQGLKMKVVAYDPFLSADRAKDLNIEKVELVDLLKRADFITLHTPLNDATRGILGKENLAKCKKGVRIINCARGGLIDEAALKAAIESGQVAGAALDVFEVEPATDNILFGMEQIVCTPHLGASTSEAQENVALQVAEQMSDYLNNGTITNAINMPSVSAEEAAKLKPYTILSEQLGSFAGQITESGIKSVEIEYLGRAAKLNVKALTSVVLKGLLEPQIEGVNMVNAGAIAKQRNIDVREVVNADAGDYQTMIRLKVTADKQTSSVAGSLFGGKNPRIVEINDVPLEAALGSNMLYITNQDKPGMIGAIGNILGAAKINIANFHLGRNDKAAVALVELDSEVSEKTLTEVEKVEAVIKAKLLKF